MENNNKFYIVDVSTGENRGPTVIDPYDDSTMDGRNQIITNYENSLRSIGIDARGKDLLEVIADIATEIDRINCELDSLRKEIRE